MEYFFDKYKIKHGDEVMGFSMLNAVNRRHPLQFPVTLKKFFNPDEAIEVIEEKSNILDLEGLRLGHLGCLQDQIMYLVHDMLIWYKKRVKVIIPACIYDAEELKRQGFIPFLSGNNSLDISITVRFYKKYGRYFKMEEREVLRYNMDCDFAFGRDDEDQCLGQEEFWAVDDIGRCLSYEFAKAWPENGFVTNYADFCITYKLKRVDRPEPPVYRRPDFSDLDR